jgi:hypothetical protein
MNFQNLLTLIENNHADKTLVIRVWYKVEETQFVGLL